MKSLLLLLAVLHFAVFTNAQTSLRTGYILTSDTIRGEVVYREGFQATKICSFKKNGATAPTDYRPEDINGYGFESRHFTAVVYKGSSQFMEVIAPGRVRLLRSMKLYYLVKDTAFVPLQTEKKYVFRNGQRYESEDKVWLGRVKPMLSDCPATAKALDKTQLSELTPRQIEQKFSKLIARYNECHGEKTRFYSAEIAKPYVSFGVLAGVSVTTATFTLISGVKESYSRSTAPAFGISLEWTNPRISERFKIRAEVLYTSAKADGTDPWDTYRSMEYSVVKVPLLLHYSFLSRRVTPFIRAGFTCNTLFNSEFIMSTAYVNRTFDKFTKFSTSVLLVGGIEFSVTPTLRTYIEARYETRSTVYEERFKKNQITASSVAFMVGVRF